MRQVRAARLGRDVSALGFGCASLGSRVSPANGRRAIDRALDLGVTWFDVAPPYGDGQAEALLGRFLQGRRDKVVVCTKFGIARPQVSFTKRLLRPFAQRLVAAFPSTRTAMRNARPLGRRARIEPAAIEVSVVTSLRFLRTDYIDVLALHEPTPQEAADAMIFEVLQRLVKRGLVRAIAVAGATESIEAAMTAGHPVDVAQFPDTPYTSAAPMLRSRLSAQVPMFATHGVFGSRIAERTAGRKPQVETALAAVAERYGIHRETLDTAMSLPFAFANNPDGVVIASMFSLAHVESNCATAAGPAMVGLAEEVRRIVSLHGAQHG